MSAPGTVFRLSCGDRQEQYMVSGDSSQMILVMLVAPAPAVELPSAPSPAMLSERVAEKPPAVTLADLERRAPGNFQPSAGVFDPLATPCEADPEELRLKYQDFYRAGGRVLEAPGQGTRSHALRLRCTVAVSLSFRPCYGRRGRCCRGRGWTTTQLERRHPPWRFPCTGVPPRHESLAGDAPGADRCSERA